MSCCRWSSDDFQSDVYVYGSGSGWTTHVAVSRRRLTGPAPEEVDLMEDPNGWLERLNVLVGLLGEPEPIGLPHDGATFNDPTPGECAKRLRELRDMGYHVPDYAIEDLEEVQRTLDDQTRPEEKEGAV